MQTWYAHIVLIVSMTKHVFMKENTKVSLYRITEYLNYMHPNSDLNFMDRAVLLLKFGLNTILGVAV